MTPEESRDVDWYYSFGACAFQRSVFGDQLDRAKNYKAEPTGKIPNCQPTAEVRPHGGYEPSHDDLERYGRVSRRLSRCSQGTQLILECWHGDRGCRFAREHHGRAGAIVHLTPSGKIILAKLRKKANAAQLEISDTERLLNELAIAAKQGTDADRKRVVGQALLEARALYERASNEY